MLSLTLARNPDSQPMRNYTALSLSHSLYQSTLKNWWRVGDYFSLCHYTTPLSSHHENANLIRRLFTTRAYIYTCDVTCVSLFLMNVFILAFAKSFLREILHGRIWLFDSFVISDYFCINILVWNDNNGLHSRFSIKRIACSMIRDWFRNWITFTQLYFRN